MPVPQLAVGLGHTRTCAQAIGGIVRTSGCPFVMLRK